MNTFMILMGIVFMAIPLCILVKEYTERKKYLQGIVVIVLAVSGLCLFTTALIKIRISEKQVETKYIIVNRPSDEFKD